MIFKYFVANLEKYEICFKLILQTGGEMRDEKRTMFRVHRVILSALSKEFRDIFSAFSASFGEEGKNIDILTIDDIYKLSRISIYASKVNIFILDDGSRLHRMNIVRIEEDASLFQVSKRQKS